LKDVQHFLHGAKFVAVEIKMELPKNYLISLSKEPVKLGFNNTSHEVIHRGRPQKKEGV
jgi:hypothetical protein